MPCREQLVELQDHRDEIEAAGGRVVAVSGDRSESLARMRETLGLSFPVLSDPSLGIARLYGVREDLRGATALRSPTPVPAVFVVDGGGRVRYAQVARDPRDRAPLRAVLAALAQADVLDRTAAPATPRAPTPAGPPDDDAPPGSRDGR